MSDSDNCDPRPDGQADQPPRTTSTLRLWVTIFIIGTSSALIIEWNPFGWFS